MGDVREDVSGESSEDRRGRDGFNEGAPEGPSPDGESRLPHPGERPSVEALLAALRKATSTASRKRATAQGTAADASSPAALSPSRANTVAKTLAAFRDAARRALQERDEPTPPAVGASSTSDEAPDETPRASEPVEVDESLAPDFRRALSERERAARRVPSTDASGRFEEASLLPNAFLWVTGPAERPSALPDDQCLPVQRLAEHPAPAAAREADAFLLAGEGHQPYRRLVQIRHHPEPDVYLKPVFWRRPEAASSPVAPHVDDAWSPAAVRETVRALQETAAAINQRIDTLRELGAGDAEGREHRMLRLVATRSDAFAPQRERDGDAPIVYPMLSPLLASSPRQEAPGERDELTDILAATARRIREG